MRAPSFTCLSTPTVRRPSPTWLHGLGAGAGTAYLLGRVEPLDALDAGRACRVHVGPHRQVLRLLKGPLGQRHLADGLLPHFRGLGEPLRLALGVKKAVALSSLLKEQAAAGQSPAHRRTTLLVAVSFGGGRSPATAGRPDLAFR